MNYNASAILYERLHDKQMHLFARDARFIERRSANNKKIFWSRGQGWVVAGLARILEAMPENYPTRKKYVSLFHPSDIIDTPLPANATPEQTREFNRRNAERQAVKDLAFYPLIDTK